MNSQGAVEWIGQCETATEWRGWREIMVALRIEDMKVFTKKLFIGETFDRFLVREASIVTFNSFTIDGRVRQGYYSEEELEA